MRGSTQISQGGGWAPGPDAVSAIHHFIKGPLTQREERSLNAPWMLDLILSLEEPREVAGQLDPTLKYHQKIVRNDHLGSLLRSQRERAWEMLERGAHGDAPEDAPFRELFERYLHAMEPFVVGILKDTVDPSSPRKQLPQGMMEGIQGRLNLIILLKYVIENELGLSKEEVADGIVNNRFTAPSFQPLGLGGALMTCFQNSPARMMLAFLRNHPDADWREHFANLELRHFAQVDNLWTRTDPPEDPRGWGRNSQGTDWTNYGEARLAVREVIHLRCGFPRDGTIAPSQYIEALHGVIQTLTQGEFDSLPGRFGRRYSSVRMHVYGGSIPEMIIDLLRTHPDATVREHFRALRPYHFPGVIKTTEYGPQTMKTYSDLALQELFSILTDQSGPHGWSYAEVPSLITAKIIEETPLRFGSTAQVFVGRYRSYVHAVISALQNHPDGTHRKFFERLRPYHFRSAGHDTWSMEPGIMPDPPYEGWTLCGESNRWKNTALAREAMDEFFECLFRNHHSWEWNLERVAKDLTLEEFRKHKILYKADVRSMIAAVYFDSAREAILDYLSTDLFRERVRGNPPLAREISAKWGSVESYLEFARDTLENRRGHRSLSSEREYTPQI